jgi:hypothetical protein
LLEAEASHEPERGWRPDDSPSPLPSPAGSTRVYREMTARCLKRRRIISGSCHLVRVSGADVDEGFD